MRHNLYYMIGLSMLILIIVTARLLVGSPTPAHSSTQTSTPKPGSFEFLGRILKINALTTIKSSDLAMWQVEAEIVTPLTNRPAPHNSGSNVIFFVHSIVKQFGEDRERVVGKVYRIRFKAAFANPYHGELVITPGDTTKKP